MWCWLSSEFFYSWAAISTINWIWVIYLFTQRSRDHKWTVAFFATYAISDCILWTMGQPNTGGWGWITPSNINYYLWMGIVNSLWAGWFCIPIFCACKLRYKRIPLPYYAACVPLLLVSWSETVGASVMQRRFVMHTILEPAMLILAMAVIAKYVARQLRDGKTIDYLGYAVALTSAVLLLKLALMFSGTGTLKRWQAHVFHFMYMTTVVLAYFGQRKLTRWLALR